MAVRVVVLLYNQQHGRGLQGHQLAQATDGQTLLLSFLLNVETARTQMQV